MKVSMTRDGLLERLWDKALLLDEAQLEHVIALLDDTAFLDQKPRPIVEKRTTEVKSHIDFIASLREKIRTTDD